MMTWLDVLSDFLIVICAPLASPASGKFTVIAPLADPGSDLVAAALRLLPGGKPPA